MVETYGLKATRIGFGEGLAELGKTNPKVVVIGADTAASASLNLFYEKFPDRFYNVGIAEQNMIGIASGLSLTGLIPFASTYAIFSSGRPWEEIRTTVCYSNLNVKIGGSHAGVMVGPDGATHQALEDIAIMRCLPKMTVIVPCDMVETKKATIAATKMYGPVYLRYGREPTPIITKEDSSFEIGKAITLKNGSDVAIFACGHLVYEALCAAEILAQSGIKVSVVNVHTIKPIDEEAIVKTAKKCGAVVTAEEHQVAGGFGSAVCEVLAKNCPVPVEMVGVFDTFGGSGAPLDLLKEYGLKAENIVAAALKAIKRK